MQRIPHRRPEACEQLGMPTGTAMHRLKKMVLFSFIQRLGEDTCFKCKQKIECYEQLSIEHKQPWLHVDPALFWDLRNIAFSHLACNKPDRPYSEKLKQYAPAGQSWCSGHKAFLPIDEFGPKKNRWNGLAHECRACDAERVRRRDQRNHVAWGKSIRVEVTSYSGTRTPNLVNTQMTFL